MRILTAIAAVLAVIAAGLETALVISLGGNWRVRDLHVWRLLRRVADQFNWNLTTHAPSWVSAMREISAANLSLLFVSSAAVLLLALLVTAMLLRLILPAGRRADAIGVSILTAVTTALMAGAFAPKPLQLMLVIGLAGASYVLMTRLGPDRLLRSPRPLTIFVVAVLGSSALAAAWASRSVSPARPAPERGAPNVLLISIDSLRADHLGAYGYDRKTSPTLDQLAADGAVFETVMAPTSWTLPSHMTLLTSIPPEKHGVITNRRRLAPGIRTLPSRFQQAGYVTAGFVSATYLDGIYGFSRGFDDYDDYSVLRTAGEKSRSAVTSSMLVGRSIQWLRQHVVSSRAPRPFFLFVHLFDVHYDYNPPPPFDRMFDASYGGSADGELNGLRRDMRGRDLRHVLALYDGEIAWVDANIANLLSALRELGLEQNTIVAITADHGEEFFDHGDRGHYRTLYDEVIHVPLIVRYPPVIPRGARIAGQARLMDVGPTLLDLARIRTIRSADRDNAVSLAPFLRQGTEKLPCLPAFGDLEGRLASVRTNKAKLIRDLQTHHEEFYDLRADPGERRNLDFDENASVHRLRELLDHWRSTASATGAAQSFDLPAEERSTLRSLGYLH